MSAHTQLADKAELAAFLAANPDIQAVQIMITDPSGVLRGKAELDYCKQWRKQFPALRDRLPWDFFSA